MRSDVEIALEAEVAPILDVAAQLGLESTEVLPYGHDKAKIGLSVLDGPRRREPSSV